MKPALEGATVQIFTEGRGDFDDAAIFDVIGDGVGDQIFLVARTKIMFVYVVDDAMQ